MLDTQYEKERTVFVGNLCASVTEEILFELFLQAGPLKKVAIARDKEGQQKSYGFVCFKHRESVPYAIALLDGIWLYGQPIRLKHRYGGSLRLQTHTLDFACVVDGGQWGGCPETFLAPLCCRESWRRT
uniref:RNA binding motif protein 11 n=1 Tax=Scleropages formosus TaxID=113540 RepID=A0A8C9RPG8_SCLFO